MADLARAALVAGALALVSCGTGSSLVGSGASGASKGSSASIGSLGSGGGGSGAGRVCGDGRIIGEVIPEIEGPGECGVRRPVRVHSVAGVDLSPQPEITCETAEALADWVEAGAKPQAEAIGERLAALDVAAGYSCRNRNGAATGRLSEHAKGNAIDIAAFRFGSGRSAIVASGWGSAEYGAMLRDIHAAGCGPFQTTLGPGSDGHHESHLHYDVAMHAGGRYCR